MSNPTSSSQIFTAAHIAVRLNKSKRAVLLTLREVVPDGVIIVKGQQANAWRLATLINSAFPDLESVARKAGYRNAEVMFTAPAKAPWQPEIVNRAGKIETVFLADLHPDGIAAAVRLQRALAASLERMNDLTLSAAEFEQCGLADYHREFGHIITDRHWRELFRRTLDRDAGAECWSRLEIYLPGNLKRKTPEIAPALAVADNEAQFRELHELIASFRNPASPSSAEKQLLWLRSFEIFTAIAEATRPPKKTRPVLLNFLWRHVPALAKSAAGLRVNFDRKHDRWLAAGGDANALADKRPAAAAKRRLEITEDDRDKIVGHAVLKCGGRRSQAWRELRESGELSEALQQRYQVNPASKSYVPQSIRAAVSTEIALLDDMHHGPRQAKLNGAYISRDWSGVFAGDWYQSDDCTAPVYYYVPDGRGWFTLMRGQFLPMIDLRSTCILDFVLISERNYNALTIRSLITKVCDKYGLPRRGFAFEGGVWKSSKILKGVSDAVPSWGEVELGLRSVGLEFRHATLPRVKPVEGLLGQLQNLMFAEPGYVGRNEMVEKFERVQRQKLEVEARKAHPEKYFYSEDQWVARLAEICEQYNHTPQAGKMTGGLAPEDAYAKFQNLSDPPVKFGATCRYLLATHKRPVRIGSNGITLRFGKREFVYRN